MAKLTDKRFHRIIDANFNRAREGLRVCEDICRFFYNKRALTNRYKDLRHQLSRVLKQRDIVEITQARDTVEDVGKKSTLSEMKRRSVDIVFYANSQRAKESVRVLEEFSKLFDVRAAEDFKKLRYRIYSIEKDAIKNFKE